MVKDLSEWVWTRLNHSHSDTGPEEDHRRGERKQPLPCIITFIDFKKAFDSIHRGKMLCILKAYGIPENLVNAIEDIYSDTKAKVLSPDGETRVF